MLIHKVKQAFYDRDLFLSCLEVASGVLLLVFQSVLFFWLVDEQVEWLWMLVCLADGKVSEAFLVWWPGRLHANAVILWALAYLYTIL